MKRLAAVLAPVAAGCALGTSSTPKTGAAMPASIVAPCLEIQLALAKDSIQKVRASAGNIATAATPLGDPAARIDMADVQLTGTTEIADARDQFSVLSKALVGDMDMSTCGSFW